MLVIVSGSSLAFSRNLLPVLFLFLLVLGPDASAPVVVINQSPKYFTKEPNLCHLLAILWEVLGRSPSVFFVGPFQSLAEFDGCCHCSQHASSTCDTYVKLWQKISRQNSQLSGFTCKLRDPDRLLESRFRASGVKCGRKTRLETGPAQKIVKQIFLFLYLLGGTYFRTCCRAGSVDCSASLPLDSVAFVELGRRMFPRTS